METGKRSAMETESRSAILTGCWLAGRCEAGEAYAERFQKWYDYYSDPHVRDALGNPDLVLFENGSPAEYYESYVSEIVPGDETLSPRSQTLRILHFNEHLGGRSRKAFHYPWGWRNVYTIPRALFAEYDKVILLDTDSFVLSGRLAKWIRELDTGFSALWTARHSLPDINCSVICRDAYPRLEEFTKSGDYRERLGKCMEVNLPLTKVVKDFVAERFGEMDLEPSPEMDFYGQARNKTKFTFFG